MASEIRHLARSGGLVPAVRSLARGLVKQEGKTQPPGKRGKGALKDDTNDTTRSTGMSLRCLPVTDL